MVEKYDLFGGLKDGMDTGLTTVENFFGSTAGAVTAGALGSAAVIGTGVAIASSVKKKRRKSNKKKSSKRKSKSKKSKSYKYARTAGKRRDTSRKRIRMTSTGQPYIILASGKARFIKKSSARNSRRRKGGRY